MSAGFILRARKPRAAAFVRWMTFLSIWKKASGLR
jgi:hypothetical protein